MTLLPISGSINKVNLTQWEWADNNTKTVPLSTGIVRFFNIKIYLIRIICMKLLKSTHEWEIYHTTLWISLKRFKCGLISLSLHAFCQASPHNTLLCIELGWCRMQMNTKTVKANELETIAPHNLHDKCSCLCQGKGGFALCCTQSAVHFYCLLRCNFLPSASRIPDIFAPDYAFTYTWWRNLR